MLHPRGSPLVAGEGRPRSWCQSIDGQRVPTLADVVSTRPESHLGAAGSRDGAPDRDVEEGCRPAPVGCQQCNREQPDVRGLGLHAAGIVLRLCNAVVEQAVQTEYCLCQEQAMV